MRVWRFIYSIEFSKTVENGVCNFSQKETKRKMTQNENHILLLMRRNFLVQHQRVRERKRSMWPRSISSTSFIADWHSSCHGISFIRHSIVMRCSAHGILASMLNALAHFSFIFHLSFSVTKWKWFMYMNFNVIYHQDDDDDNDEDINPNSECLGTKSLNTNAWAIFCCCGPCISLFILMDSIVLLYHVITYSFYASQEILFFFCFYFFSGRLNDSLSLSMAASNVLMSVEDAFRSVFVPMSIVYRSLCSFFPCSLFNCTIFYLKSLRFFGNLAKKMSSKVESIWFFRIFHFIER